MCSVSLGIRVVRVGREEGGRQTQVNCNYMYLHSYFHITSLNTYVLWFWLCAYENQKNLCGINKHDKYKCAGTMKKVNIVRMKTENKSRVLMVDGVCDEEVRQSWGSPGGCLFSSSAPARGLSSGVIYTDRPLWFPLRTTIHHHHPPLP